MAGSSSDVYWHPDDLLAEVTEVLILRQRPPPDSSCRLAVGTLSNVYGI